MYHEGAWLLQAWDRLMWLWPRTLTLRDGTRPVQRKNPSSQNSTNNFSLYWSTGKVGGVKLQGALTSSLQSIGMTHVFPACPVVLLSSALGLDTVPGSAGCFSKRLQTRDLTEIHFLQFWKLKFKLRAASQALKMAYGHCALTW